MKTKDTNQTMTRRSAVKATGAAVTGPSIISVVGAQTASGEIEAEVTATIPSGTSATLRVQEHLQNVSIYPFDYQEATLSDGTNTHVFDELQGGNNDGHEYRLFLELDSNGDGSETPEIDSVTITLPDDGVETDPEDGDDGDDGDGGVSDGQQSIGQLWDNFLVTTTLSVIIIGSIGLASRSLAVASIPAYLLFAYIAVETGHPILENVLYVTVVLIMVGMAFKMWRLEGSGST